MSAFRKLQCREGYRRGRRLWAVRVDQNMLVWPERGDAAKGRNEPRLYNAASDTSDSLGDDMIKRSAKAEVFQGVVFCLT